MKKIQIDDLELIYQRPADFNHYYSIYYGQKYSDYYFRSTPKTLLEKTEIYDCSYLIQKAGKLIGGVQIKPNFMHDLFVIPPYKDYDYLVDKLITYLKEISNKNEKILIHEVIEEKLPAYDKQGVTYGDQGYWMIRPTEKYNLDSPDDYKFISVKKEDKEKIADVFLDAYGNNPAFLTVGSKEDYMASIERFVTNQQNNEIIYNASKTVIHIPTGEIVGICLNMEFERYPLIMYFAVKSAHQKKGIGTYLLKHIITTAHEKYEAIRLYVFKDNEVLRLYESLGFIRNRTINDLYLD